MGSTFLMCGSYEADKLEHVILYGNDMVLHVVQMWSYLTAQGFRYTHREIISKGKPAYKRRSHPR